MGVPVRFVLMDWSRLHEATTGATPLSLIKGMITGRHEHPADERAPHAGHHDA